MDVNRDNFAEVYPAFVEQLATCKFVSFDEEMTGIFGQNAQRHDDDVNQRYLKMAEIATKYGIIQFGICLFHESADGSALVATPYNFYIFPNSRDDLVVSPSAIEFLRKNKMDFNEWLSKGITYVAAENEQWWKNKLFPQPASAPTGTEEAPEKKEPIKVTRPSDIEFIERNMALVDAMLASTDCNEEGTGAGDLVALESTNAFLRRVMYEQLELRYAGKVNVTKNEQNILSALKMDPSKQAAFELKQRLEKERQLQDTLGFRRVFNALAAAKKPLVGHNLFFDLCFMMRWLEGPLASDFDTFRTSLHELFPCIYDTKLLADNATLEVNGSISDTALDKCYAYYVKNRPHTTSATTTSTTSTTGTVATTGTAEVVAVRTSGVEIRMSPLVVGYDPAAPQFHNAGYDAYVTGCVFARQVEIVQAQGGVQVLPASSLDFVAGPHTAYKNTIYMMRSFYHAHLSPDQPLGSLYRAGTTFRVSQFDRGVQGSHVNNVMTEAGLEAGTFEVMWVDGESFFVHFPLLELVETNMTEATEEKKAVFSHTLQRKAGANAVVSWPAGWKLETLDAYAQGKASALAATVDKEAAGESGVKRARLE